mmetsp:Transcript_17511/g.37844  ORF Transcript_17511/g.37844 Transcript_17511/m.37844 type:complete len:91 (-) Transcript_17511:363-635(-)
MCVYTKEQQHDNIHCYARHIRANLFCQVLAYIAGSQARQAVAVTATQSSAAELLNDSKRRCVRMCVWGGYSYERALPTCVMSCFEWRELC